MKWIFLLLTASIAIGIPFDKVRHVGISAVLSSGFSVVTDDLTAFSLAMALGILKEIIDYFGFGTPDLEDLLADLFGSVIGIALSRDGEIVFIWEF